MKEVNKINKDSFKEFIKYFSKLKNENIISENLLTDLLTLICANFIENEVELRINNTIQNKLFKYFQ